MIHESTRSRPSQLIVSRGVPKKPRTSACVGYSSFEGGARSRAPRGRRDRCVRCAWRDDRLGQYPTRLVMPSCGCWGLKRPPSTHSCDLRKSHAERRTCISGLAATSDRGTFLVWPRTGLWLIAVRVAGWFLAAQFIPGVPYMRWFWALLVSSGTMNAPYWASRYGKAYHRFDRRSIDPAGKAIVSTAASVALFGLLPSPLLLWLR
jgi:hypothetical protein